MNKVEMYQEKKVQLKEIVPNPWNPHNSTAEELQNLMKSLSERGMIHPIIVVEWDRPLTWKDKVHEVQRPYLLIDGHQRFKAVQQMFVEGDDSLFDQVPVRVIGKLSEWEEWELAEIGQMANHQGGSIEDPQKTGDLVQLLKSRRRDITEIANLLGQRSDFLERSEIVSRASNLPDRSGHGLTHDSKRKTYNVVLPFERSEDVDEFERLVKQIADGLQDVPATKGMVRSLAALHAVKEFFSE